MARASGMVGLRPYHQPKPMAGTAVTVHTRPGDNLAIHRAFDFCRPGDVLVIDGSGDLTQALMGEIMASFAESQWEFRPLVGRASSRPDDEQLTSRAALERA